jgi:hypothetical protein
MTAEQMADFLNLLETTNRRREAWDLIPNPYTGDIEKYGKASQPKLPAAKQDKPFNLHELTLGNQRRDDANLIQESGLRSPEEYSQIVEIFANQFPGIGNQIRISLIKAYLMMMFSLFEAEDQKQDAYTVSFQNAIATVGRKNKTDRGKLYAKL